MNITVMAPRLRFEVRECKDLRSGRGRSKANIQTWIEGTTDLAGVTADNAAGGRAVSFVAFDSTERTAILAEVAA